MVCQRFGLKTIGTVCQWFGLKTTGMICQWFGLNHWDYFFGLASKSVATVFSGFASKPVVTISPGLASKPVARVSQFGPQNRQLWFSDLGLKITATVSWFGPQYQVGDGLSVVPQNRWEDKVGMGHASRSSNLLHVKASRARVSQFASKRFSRPCCARVILRKRIEVVLQGAQAPDPRYTNH
jgi:hypothetical protein